MRHRGFARVFASVCVGVLGLTVSACLRQGGVPEEYALGAVPAEGDETAFAAAAGDIVYFRGDSAALSADAKATLQKQIRWLNQNPDLRVVIEGHADEWGTLEHNLSLGAKRAVAVKTYLKRNGLRASQVHTVSYGKERLVADCTALTCRAKNRRAQTVVSAPLAFLGSSER